MKTIYTTFFATITFLVLASASPAASSASAKTCIVTGNELGSMGPVVTTVHEGQKVKFCCKPCIAKFKKNPAKYLGKK